MIITKKELYSYKRLKKEADNLKQQAEEFAEDIKDLKGVVIDGMPKANTFANDKIGNMVAKAEELWQNYLCKLDEALCLLHKIEEVISSLDDPTERQIVRMKFLQDATMQYIGDKIGYTRKQVYNILNAALDKIT